jgi:PAS domain S-box-containing protein
MAHRFGTSMTSLHDKESVSDAAEPAWARNLRLVLALYAHVGGAISFLGWAADIPGLTDWSHTGVSIQPNSTIAVTFAAAAILFIHLGYRWLALPLGIIVAAIGVSSLFQLLSGTDLGINTLVMFDREWGRVGVVAPGQIGTPGSVSYTLIGVAITLVSVTYTHRRGVLRAMAASFSVITAAISTLSLTGYLYGAKPLYTLPKISVIALQTATFVLALSISMIFTVRDVGPARLLTENNAAGLMTRRVAPAVILLPILLGFLRLMGEQAGLYDLAFGTAARTLIEILLLLLLLAWGATAVSRQSGRAEQQERNLRRLADAMPQVVWIANADGRVNYYNSRASAFGGIKPAPEDLFNWQPGLHGDDREATIAAWQEAVRENRAYEHEHRILMADGTYRWHLSRAIPVTDQDGQQWFGTATDIHDLKRANTMIRESEQRFSRFMHHLPGLAWIKDAAGRYVYTNEAAEKAFGREAHDLYGKTDAEIFPADTAVSFMQNDKRALESDTGVQVIETLIDETGNSRESIVSKFAIPVANAGGPLIGGMAIDITEQRRTQANQQFLFTIGEMIRISRDPAELFAEISKAVGRHLDIHRCFFNEIDVQQDFSVAHTDYFRSGASVGGKHKLSDYSSRTRELMTLGQTVINRDSATDPRTSDIFSTIYEPNQELAYVAVPMLRDGQWVASFWCSDDKPRDWSPAEISLIEAVAERAWAAVETARAEEALRDSEERFRLAQQAGNVGIWDWDIVAGRTYWSEQMWTLYDEQPKDIDPDIGFWNAHLHPDDQKRALDVFERSLSSDTDHHNDIYRVVLKSGGVRWLEAIATIERDEAGKPIRMYGVNLDITEQQVAHDELEVRVVERTQELARTNSLLLRQMEERTLIEDQRVQLLKRLFTVQEDERGRIARDIHDHLGQRLTALRLKIASVRALCDNDPVLVQRVNRLQEISEILDKEVSFLAWELRPEILDQTDFVHALEQYVHEWSRHSDVFAEFSMIGLKANDLDTDVKNNLYRITQEALNNAAKYSQATQMNVILEQRGSELLLIIEDNGVGFDIGSTNGDGKRKGFGLVGMRERATLVGGTLEIESAKERGTTVFVRVPFSEGN